MNKKGNKTKVVRKATFLTLIIIGICFLFVPLFKNLKFGLDLQGGFEVLYKVESIDGSKMTSSKMTATYKTLSKRIDSIGVSEPEIILEGNDRIRVKLAGVTDPEEARSQLSTVASLTFRDVDDKLLMASDVLEAGKAKVGQDESGNPAVALTVKDKDKFYNVTKEISEREDGENMIVIWLDFNQMTDSFADDSTKCGTVGSNCLSAATVSQGFASDVIIQGDFTLEEVENLVDLINSGSLPSKLSEVSSRTVGAAFGDQTLEKTLVAGIGGVVAIITILIVVYHFSGFIASCAMMLYTFLVFLVFWLVGGVLTLPGIAALVLGIGMAVDSNVITFSRIRDELHSGKSLPLAVREGTKSSFSAIIDGNVTTLLVGIIMFIFGESSIKGFATMNIITVLVTMVTMVFLTRWLVNSFVKTDYFNDKVNLFINVKKENIPDVSKNEEIKMIPFKNVNFLKHRGLWSLLSVIIIAIGGIVIGIKGLNLGIDFKAGSDITIATEEKLTTKTLTTDLEELGIEATDISFEDEEIVVRVSKAFNGEEVKKVNKYFEDKYDAKVNIGVVSNVVKKELVKNAVLAVTIALVGIILYVSVRFKFSYAIGGVVALVHDVAVMFALFALFRLEVDTMFIAAVLAIIGYSINDTIVSFDRVRENLAKANKKKLTKDELENICNRSIQETFSRTLFTSITTLIPIAALMILGPQEIFTFNIAMLIGLVVGTYSSIFISMGVFIFFEKKNIGKPQKQKRIYTDEFEEKKVKGINC